MNEVPKSVLCFARQYKLLDNMGVGIDIHRFASYVFSPVLEGRFAIYRDEETGKTATVSASGLEQFISQLSILGNNTRTDGNITKSFSHPRNVLRMCEDAKYTNYPFALAFIECWNN